MGGADCAERSPQATQCCTQVDISGVASAQGRPLISSSVNAHCDAKNQGWFYLYMLPIRPCQANIHSQHLFSKVGQMQLHGERMYATTTHRICVASASPLCIPNCHLGVASCFFSLFCLCVVQRFCVVCPPLGVHSAACASGSRVLLARSGTCTSNSPTLFHVAHECGLVSTCAGRLLLSWHFLSLCFFRSVSHRSARSDFFHPDLQSFLLVLQQHQRENGSSLRARSQRV